MEIYPLSDNITPITKIATRKNATPYVGQILPNALNGEILEFHQRNAEGNGFLASWFVLCFLPNDTYTPYVVWTLINRPEGWYAESGDYYRTLDEAQQGYNERAGLSFSE